MTGSKKRLRKIIILATVLLSFAMLLYLQNLQKVKERQRKLTAAQSERTAGVRSPGRQSLNLMDQLPDWQPDNIGAISLEQEAGDTASRLELRRSEERQEEPQSRWQLSHPSGIPVRESAVQGLARVALYPFGQQLPGSFDLSQATLQERYGFSQPFLTIDYFGRSKDGGAADELLGRLMIGAEIPGIGGYYATVEAGSSMGARRILFRLSNELVGGLGTDANGLREQSLPRVNLLSNQQQHLNTLQLNTKERVLRIEYKSEELARRHSSINELQSFVMTKPYGTVRGVDQYQLERLLKRLPEVIQILSYVEDQPADLEPYGLGPEQRGEIYAKDNSGGELSLWLGREADESSVYAMRAGYESVFTVSKEVLAVLDFEPFQMVDKFVLLLNISRIEQVQLLRSGDAGLSYHFQILHESGPRSQDSVQGSGRDEVSGSRLTENRSLQERDLGEKLTKDLYQEFLSIFLVGEVPGSFLPVDKAAVSLIYSLRDGSRRRADFYNYSVKGYYVVAVDGGRAAFVTEKRQLDQLLEDTGRVLQTGQLNVLR